jgi:hypothetical protein
MSNTAYTAGYKSSIWMAQCTFSGGVYTPGSYTKIGQTKDIKGPSPEVGEIKLTNNDSPNNTKESAPGMIEPGDISFELYYTPTGYTALYTAFGDGNMYSFKEIFADASGFTSLGYLKKLPVETKTEDEANMVNVEIKLTAKPMFTATGLS